MSEQENFPQEYFDHQKQITAEMSQKGIFLFLDYDGTLTPIVSKPDLAVLSAEMRETVRAAVKKLTVSIVSGRATDDVRSKVQIDGIFYAGSHGFEIIDPQGQVTINDEAQQARAVIDQVHAELSEKAKGIDGALIEHVKYTISAHYRLVADKDLARFEGLVDETLEQYPQLRKTSGKKVFELRPRIDWDKGKAVNWIMDCLAFDPRQHIAIYIGDDTTDEDAFRVLEGKGFGILVAAENRASAAQYRIKDTAEVRQVLLSFLK